MNKDLDKVIDAMRVASDNFYNQAFWIGNHPFLEFAGLLNEYIKCAHEANKKGIDFTQCNKHIGNQLPIPDYSKNYINEKLECIFTGISIGESKYVLQLDNPDEFPKEAIKIYNVFIENYCPVSLEKLLTTFANTTYTNEEGKQEKFLFTIKEIRDNIVLISYPKGIST